MSICDQISKCKQETKVPATILIDSKGGNSKYRIDNPGRKVFEIIDYENCVYSGRENDTKCDFGVLANNDAFYIELKGCDVSTGVNQLLATIKETHRCFAGRNLRARLIVTKFGKPNLIRKKGEYRDLMNFVKNDLIITQLRHTESI